MGWFCHLSEYFSLLRVRKNTRRESFGGSGSKELPDDLIADILSRLPAECVLKQRRVCKRWLALTSTPYFAQLHLKRSTGATILLQTRAREGQNDKLNVFRLGENTTNKVTNKNPPTLKKTIRGGFVTAERESDLKIYTCCDGFLVFQDMQCGSRFVVCNIVTREQVTVKAPISKNLCVHAMFLHPVTREYMMLFENPAQGTWPNFTSFDFYLYGFNSKLWRKISSFHQIPEYMSTPVVLNNNLHWLTSRRRHIPFDYSPPCDSAMFIFGTVSEELRVMPHPGNTCSSPYHHCGGMYIYEVEGTLCLCRIELARRGSADIWALEDYDNWCWAKKKTILNDNINLIRPTRLISNHELLFLLGTQFYKVNIVKNHQQPEILVNMTAKEFETKFFQHDTGLFTITKSFVSLKPSNDHGIIKLSK